MKPRQRGDPAKPCDHRGALRLWVWALRAGHGRRRCAPDCAGVVGVDRTRDVTMLQSDQPIIGSRYFIPSSCFLKYLLARFAALSSASGNFFDCAPPREGSIGTILPTDNRRKNAPIAGLVGIAGERLGTGYLAERAGFEPVSKTGSPMKRGAKFALECPEIRSFATRNRHKCICT